MSEKEFIRFDLIEKKPKTSIFAVVNIKFGNRLGIIKWYPSWRKYCFFAQGYTIYDTICLNEIKNFIQGLMGERKIEKKSDVLIDATKARIQKLIDERKANIIKL